MPDRDRLVQRLRAAGCVFAEEEADALLAADGDLEDLVGRREAGEPLEQILGGTWFCGQWVRLQPGVFVPRQRSAVLVAHVVQLLDGIPAPVVVDLCCGSGALGVAVLARVPSARVVASDLDPDAVACARLNLPDVRLGDLYDALPDTLAGAVDVVMAHAPYVPTEAIAGMPPEARDHEARIALDGGGDGLDVVRRALAGAPDWLRPGGTVLVETSTRQATAALDLVGGAGLVPALVTDDEVGATVVTGRSAAPEVRGPAPVER